MVNPRPSEAWTGRFQKVRLAGRYDKYADGKGQPPNLSESERWNKTFNLRNQLAAPATEPPISSITRSGDVRHGILPNPDVVCQALAG